MKIPLDKNDKIWEAVSIVLLLVNALIMAFTWPSLAESVPIHFDSSGKANGWGSKYLLWIGFGISLFIYLLMTLISQKPGFYRYRMTGTNLPEQYRLTAKMARTVKAFILLALIFMTVFMLQTAQSKWTKMIPILFPIVFGLVIPPCIYYAAQITKVQSSQEK